MTNCYEYLTSYLFLRLTVFVIIGVVCCSSDRLTSSSNVVNLKDVCGTFDKSYQTLTCENLHVGDGNITELNGNNFKNPALKILTIHRSSFNKLIHINADELAVLHIISTKIKNFAKSSLQLPPNLKELLFNENELENLPDDVFDRLENLQYLSIQNNPLTELSNRLFSDLINLKTLVIKNTKIKQLSPHVFEPLISIINIDLSNNKIDFLPSNVFHKNPNLNRLILSGNNLSKIELNSAKTLEVLHLPMNSFEELFLDKLPDTLFELYLGGHSLRRVVKSNTMLKYNLQKIYFTGNESINFEFLENICNLKYLHLINCSIQNAIVSINKRESCYGEPTIEFLRLAQNNLKHINIELLAAFKNLHTLYVEGNHLMEIPYEKLALDHPLLSFVGFSGNFWNCSFNEKMAKFFVSKQIRFNSPNCIDCNTDFDHIYYHVSCPGSNLPDYSTTFDYEHTSDDTHLTFDGHLDYTTNDNQEHFDYSNQEYFDYSTQEYIDYSTNDNLEHFDYSKIENREHFDYSTTDNQEHFDYSTNGNREHFDYSTIDNQEDIDSTTEEVLNYSTLHASEELSKPENHDFSTESVFYPSQRPENLESESNLAQHEKHIYLYTIIIILILLILCIIIIIVMLCKICNKTTSRKLVINNVSKETSDRAVCHSVIYRNNDYY